MTISINPSLPAHTNLLRAGMVLSVAGPTSGNATVTLTRGAAGAANGFWTTGPAVVAANATSAFGPYSNDLNFSISATGLGSTATIQESTTELQV